MSSVAAAAQQKLRRLFGTAPGAASSGIAPGRCTLVGEHVDYAGGLVLAMAIGQHLAVAARPSGGPSWRACSGSDVAEAAGPHIPDVERAQEPLRRVLAVARSLADRGVMVPPAEVAIASTIPAGAGLSSSAALSVAAAIALGDMVAIRWRPAELADIAYHAEHDILGIPCGRLDQITVSTAADRAALLLDCHRNCQQNVAWPWDDVVVVVCDTRERHEVAGPAYADRVAAVHEAMRQLRMDSLQGPMDPAVIEALAAPLDRRVRHVVGECSRVRRSVAALQQGDRVALGREMAASHRSLRDDFEVSTPLLDGIVVAAQAQTGCHGARLVGAGFGGSVIALCDRGAAGACGEAMVAAARRRGPRPRSFVVTPSPGAADLNPGRVAPL